MILIIDTANSEIIKLALAKNNKIIASLEIKARLKQAEKLLSGIDSLLTRNGSSIKDIKGIKVASRGDSFTSLRIGVVTANALAYALGVDIRSFADSITTKEQILEEKLKNSVRPIYNRQPDIKIKKKEF